MLGWVFALGFRGDGSVGECRAGRVCELKIHVIAECYMFGFVGFGEVEDLSNLKPSVGIDARRGFTAVIEFWSLRLADYISTTYLGLAATKEFARNLGR